MFLLNAHRAKNQTQIVAKKGRNRLIKGGLRISNLLRIWTYPSNRSLFSNNAHTVWSKLCASALPIPVDEALCII